ncbi:heterokaryon incompatibility protein [Colletotrichum plurivorum]|uniref:Heterokaryon incompatibility protein n=1 Tax=Colletotrichum plurivorum TaxID=2175906 RepID=A0A8H6J1W5_9PEZI|nr:heterokaryon incompatibility protein [Colletotrichum plurivorum]
MYRELLLHPFLTRSGILFYQQFQTTFAFDYLQYDKRNLYPDFRLAGIDDDTETTEEIRRKIRLWAGTKSIAATKAGEEDKLYKSITDPYEIRVLEIKPGEGDERLEGSLHHSSVEFESTDKMITKRPGRFGAAIFYTTREALAMNDLTTPISYTALSYTWGEPVYEGIFECDGRVMRITKSLECALRYLRQRPYFKANGIYLRSLMKIPTVDSQRPTDLLVRGISFDVLVTSSGLFDDPVLNPNAENKTLLEVVAFFSQIKEYPTTETVFSVFWHTIVAGKGDLDRLGCPDSFEEIVSHILDLSTGRQNSLPGQTYTARQNRPPGRGGLDQKKLESRKPGSAGDTFQKVRTAMINALKNRRLGMTEKWYVGLFAEHLEVGDQIWILDGCHVPFLLRPAGGDGRFRLIGECYVHGIMGGEAVDVSSTLRDIVLV